MTDHIATSEDAEAMYAPMKQVIRAQVNAHGSIALPAIVFAAIQVASEHGLLPTFEQTLDEALKTARGAMALQKAMLS